MRMLEISIGIDSEASLYACDVRLLKSEPIANSAFEINIAWILYCITLYIILYYSTLYRSIMNWRLSSPTVDISPWGHDNVPRHQIIRPVLRALLTHYDRFSINQGSPWSTRSSSLVGFGPSGNALRAAAYCFTFSVRPISLLTLWISHCLTQA